MAISFRLRLWDYFWFTCHSLFGDAGRKRWLLTVLVALGVLSALPHLSSPMTAIAVVAGYVLFLLISLVVALFVFTLGVCGLARFVAPARSSAFCQVRVVLEAGGVLVDSGTGQIKFNWAELRALVRARRHLVLRFQEFGAVIIPRRAFSSDSELNGFLDACERFSSRPTW